jgi:ABC-type phosphate/phosphonate transport system substrate-binding protein
MAGPRGRIVVGLGCMIAACGCQESEPRGSAVDIPHGIQVVFKPMTELLGLPETVRIAITRDHLPNFSLVPDLSTLDRFMGPLEPAPWFGLETAIQRDLKRPVRFIRSNYRSIRYHMGAGRMHFAMVSATEYAEITRRPVSRIVAIPVNIKGTMEHCGLIIVKKESKIESLGELKGKRFAFGPQNDVILHQGALEALSKAGVTEKDIPKELLPPYGYHINSFEVAKSVLLEGVDAGVVDELDFDSWPEKSTVLTMLSVCRDRYRVIGKTEPMPEGPFIASVKVEPELFAQMQDLLINKLNGDKAVLGKLNYTKFVQGDPKLYQPVIEKLGITPETTTTTASQPDHEVEEIPDAK